MEYRYLYGHTGDHSLRGTVLSGTVLRHQRHCLLYRAQEKRDLFHTLRDHLRLAASHGSGGASDLLSHEPEPAPRRKQQRALSSVRIVCVHLHICFFRRVLLYGHQPDPQQFHGDRRVVGTVCDVLLCRLLQTEHHTQHVCLSGLSALGIRKAILSGCRDRTACLQRSADRAAAV